MQCVTSTSWRKWFGQGHNHTGALNGSSFLLAHPTSVDYGKQRWSRWSTICVESLAIPFSTTRRWQLFFAKLNKYWTIVHWWLSRTTHMTSLRSLRRCLLMAADWMLSRNPVCRRWMPEVIQRNDFAVFNSYSLNFRSDGLLSMCITSTSNKWRQERANVSVDDVVLITDDGISTTAVEYWSSDAIETWSRRLSTLHLARQWQWWGHRAVSSQGLSESCVVYQLRTMTSTMQTLNVMHTMRSNTNDNETAFCGFVANVEATVTH